MVEPPAEPHSYRTVVFVMAALVVAVLIAVEIVEGGFQPAVDCLLQLFHIPVHFLIRVFPRVVADSSAFQSD